MSTVLLTHKYNTNTVDCSTGKGEKLFICKNSRCNRNSTSLLPSNPNVNKVLWLFVVIDCASCRLFFFFISGWLKAELVFSIRLCYFA